MSILKFFRRDPDAVQPDDEASLEQDAGKSDTSLSAEIEEQINRLPDFKQKAARAKVTKYRDRVQPHTDEGGDAYYIGDAYEDVSLRCQEEWSKDQVPGEYLQYVQSLSQTWKHLEYLSLWMLVGCAPPKWRYVKGGTDRRKERIRRTKVCVLDYSESNMLQCELFDSTPLLKDFLEAPATDDTTIRLVIAEDLSRDLVEMLGQQYDIDPLFFLSHIGDYLFHNPRDRWVELPDLDAESSERTHFNIQYLRPRYFKTEDEYAAAEEDSGAFNVLRRIDSDRSRTALQHNLMDKLESSVSLSRAKSSFWYQPRTAEKPMIALLLVDPSVTTGHPIWGGYRPFGSTPSMRQWRQGGRVPPEAPSRESPLFDHIVHWSQKLTKEDLALVKEDPRYLALPMYKLIIADWLAVLKYMTSMFSLIEWSFSRPHWGQEPGDMDELLRKLTPWRRNIPYYQGMVDDAIKRLFPLSTTGKLTTSRDLAFSARAKSTEFGIYSLWPDFKHIKHQLEEHRCRIMSIQANATTHNRNLARLSFLATFFIPLSFITGFLSMSPDFPTSTNYTTIWLFFVLGIPTTALAFLIVDWTEPGGKGYSRRLWKLVYKKPPKPHLHWGTQAVQPVNGPKAAKTFELGLKWKGDADRKGS